MKSRATSKLSKAYFKKTIEKEQGTGFSIHMSLSI